MRLSILLPRSCYKFSAIFFIHYVSYKQNPELLVKKIRLQYKRYLLGETSALSRLEGESFRWQLGILPSVAPEA